MSATPRDLAVPELWQASLRRSLARRERPRNPASAERRRARGRQTRSVRREPATRPAPPARVRDLAEREAWELSLGRSRARRRAAELQFVPARTRAMRLSLGTLIALAAAPAASLGDTSGVSSASGKAATPLASTEHEILPSRGGEAREVKLLQSLLHIAVDGEFGPETLAAVERFQREHGLEADGAVGPETWSALGYANVKEILPLLRARPRTSRGRAAARPRTSRDGVTARPRTSRDGVTARPRTSRDGVTARPRRSRGGVAARSGGAESGDGARNAAVRAAREAGAASAPAPPSRPAGSRFALCVANHEAGDAGSTSPATVNWTIKDAPYEGGFQWRTSTWLSQGGGRYAPRAVEATPAQQIAVFEAAEPSDPGAWPTSVRACGR
jgi:peptidoglycan hydrolase-like protein with peptidoglycan-binding domain